MYIKEDQPRMPWGSLEDSNCNRNTTIFTEIKSADQNNYILIKKKYVTTLVFLVLDLPWAVLLLFYIKRILKYVLIPGMLSIGICRTPSLKQERPG